MLNIVRWISDSILKYNYFGINYIKSLLPSTLLGIRGLVQLNWFEDEQRIEYWSISWHCQFRHGQITKKLIIIVIYKVSYIPFWLLNNFPQDDFIFVFTCSRPKQSSEALSRSHCVIRRNSLTCQLCSVAFAREACQLRMENNVVSILLKQYRHKSNEATKLVILFT